MLFSTTFVFVAGRFLWYGLLPLYLRRLGAADAQVSFVFTVALMLGLTQILGGIISDRWGRRYSISLPSIAIVPALLFGALAQHWIHLAITVWLIAFFGGVQQPGFQALLAESCTDQDRGRVFGMFYTVSGLAWIVGPALGAALYPALGVNGLIWLNMGIALAAALARLFFLREGEFAVSDTEAAPLPIMSLLRSRMIFSLIAANSLFLLMQSLTTRESSPFVAFHAADALSMSEQAIQLLFSSGGFGAVVAALAGGWLVDRFGGPSLIAVTLIAHILLLLGWAAFGGASVAGYTLFGASWIALQIGSVGFASWYTAYVPVRIRGRILGSLGAVGTFVSALGPQIGNAIRNTSLNPGVALHVPLRLASASPFIAALIIAVLLAAQILRMPTRADAAQAFARISGR